MGMRVYVVLIVIFIQLADDATGGKVTDAVGILLCLPAPSAVKLPAYSLSRHGTTGFDW